MEILKTKTQIITAQANILKSLLSERPQLFSDLKGLLFRLEITNEPYPIKENGFCEKFDNYDDIDKLFKALEIHNYEDKLKTLYHPYLKNNEVYLTFRMRSS